MSTSDEQKRARMVRIALTAHRGRSTYAEAEAGILKITEQMTGVDCAYLDAEFPEEDEEWVEAVNRLARLYDARISEHGTDEPGNAGSQ